MCLHAPKLHWVVYFRGKFLFVHHLLSPPPPLYSKVYVKAYNNIHMCNGLSELQVFQDIFFGIWHTFCKAIPCAQPGMSNYAELDYMKPFMIMEYTRQKEDCHPWHLILSTTKMEDHTLTFKKNVPGGWRQVSGGQMTTEQEIGSLRWAPVMAWTGRIQPTLTKICQSMSNITLTSVNVINGLFLCKKKMFLVWCPFKYRNTSAM